ncbi:hypothetical protein DM860_015439 [Cuscuta australis]|uniref:PORR domain-containing protein n=1 Tax=Cuscuta australis TaxID=267555 RepID=A0A328EB58_9ASTE|nr:hypothetical protein DM860_015439 [Cuscuta australis]
MNTIHFFRRSLPNSVSRCQRRTLYDAASSIICVRDRGLDHAVEREKNLKPVWNVKNLIKSEPSKSLPLNIITQSKDSLEIPTRPIEFLRKYPAIFQEFFPGGVNIHPHIKLTPEVLNLDLEEQLLYQSVSYRENLADRILKLLMIGKSNKFPLSVLDTLRWDLGLPHDFVNIIVPEFPDYFRVSGDGATLELVCWSHELAVSEMEKSAKKDGGHGHDVESPVNFCLKHSTGFEMDKKYQKWVNEWQKLPYLSPYKSAMHLASNCDESDKWAVGVLHELLSLCVGKAEKDNVLVLGEHLGLRSRFKRALLQHPGIFYISSKNRTHTVVLKDAYKRGVLVAKCPMMEMRFKYARLMNTLSDDKKTSCAHGKISIDLKGRKQEKLDDEDGGEDDRDFSDDYEDDEQEQDEEEATITGRSSFKTKDEDDTSRSITRRLARRDSIWKKDCPPRSRRRVANHNVHEEVKEAKNGRRSNFSTTFDRKNPLRRFRPDCETRRGEKSSHI